MVSDTTKTAVVTGGDSGIGLATAKEMAKCNINIILTDKTQRELEKSGETVKKYTSGGNAVQTIRADVRNNEDIKELAEKSKESFGNIDIVVHCAGVHGASGDFLDLSDSDWKEALDIDLMGAVRVCRAFLPQMLEKKWGRIVLVASENALQPYKEESPYNACKAGIINLTKCLSRAYSPKGIMINSVSPAFIATPMTDEMMKQKAEKKNCSKEEAIQEFLKEERPNIVKNRRGQPEEVAHLIRFLSSEEASFMTGSNHRVDGGSVSTAFG